MKKIFLLMLSLGFIATESFAQEKKGNEYLSFAIGPSIPTGDISKKKSATCTYTVLQQPGIQLNGSYQYFVNSHFAFTAQVKGQYIPISKSSLASEYSNKKFYSPVFWNGVPPPPPPVYVTYNNWKFNSSGWIITSLMGGFEGNLPLNEHDQWVFTFHTLLGATYISTPHYKGQSTTDTSVVITEQKSNSAVGFTYHAGIGLKYTINKKMFALIQGNYTGTATINNNITTTESAAFTLTGGLGGPQSTFSTFKSGVKQTITTINIGAGLRVSPVTLYPTGIAAAIITGINSWYNNSG